MMVLTQNLEFRRCNPFLSGVRYLAVKQKIKRTGHINFFHSYLHLTVFNSSLNVLSEKNLRK